MVVSNMWMLLCSIGMCVSHESIGHNCSVETRETRARGRHTPRASRARSAAPARETTRQQQKQRSRVDIVFDSEPVAVAQGRILHRRGVGEYTFVHTTLVVVYI